MLLNEVRKGRRTGNGVASNSGKKKGAQRGRGSSEALIRQAAGGSMRGNLEKSVSILARVWVDPPEGLEDLRNFGLELLSSVGKSERIAIHWGMVCAVYPFFRAVAEHVGRLLNLQEEFDSRQIQRRLRERLGDRRTVSDATTKVLKSMADWGVLRELSSRKAYTRGRTQTIRSQEVVAFLIEALLHAQDSNALALESAVRSPSLFPFKFGYISVQELLKASSQLDVVRHGVDQDLFVLKPKPQSRVRADALPLFTSD